MKKLTDLVQNFFPHKKSYSKQKHTTSPTSLADIEPILKSQLIFVYAFVNQKEKIRALGYNTDTRTFLIDHIGENRLNINSSKKELKELFSGWYNSPVTELAMNAPSNAGFTLRNGKITPEDIGKLTRIIYKDQQTNLNNAKPATAKDAQNSLGN